MAEVAGVGPAITESKSAALPLGYTPMYLIDCSRCVLGYAARALYAARLLGPDVSFGDRPPEHLLFVGKRKIYFAPAQDLHLQSHKRPACFKPRFHF